MNEQPDLTPPRLTPTEQRLCDVLRQEPSRVFSRGELTRLVMPRTIVLARTVDVHVRAVRKKLGPASIRTVRGRGYRWGGD